MVVFRVTLWLFYLCTYFVSLTSPQCVQTSLDGGTLPVFDDYGRNVERIVLHHQAIIPNYQFTCCGDIREWGADIQPGGGRDQRSYSFDFQVWRPSPTVNSTECYSLVGNNRFTSVFLMGNTARMTPSPTDYIQFQPGDVLGFYVENARANDGGIALLNTGTFTNVVVWHASIALAGATSTVGSCPYSVGPNGVLSTSTGAAPVISIATMTYSCPMVSTTDVIPSSPTPSSSMSSIRTSSTSTVENITTLFSSSLFTTVELSSDLSHTQQSSYRISGTSTASLFQATTRLTQNLPEISNTITAVYTGSVSLSDEIRNTLESESTTLSSQQSTFRAPRILSTSITSNGTLSPFQTSTRLPANVTEALNIVTTFYTGPTSSTDEIRRPSESDVQTRLTQQASFRTSRALSTSTLSISVMSTFQTTIEPSHNILESITTTLYTGSVSLSDETSSPTRNETGTLSSLQTSRRISETLSTSTTSVDTTRSPFQTSSGQQENLPGSSNTSMIRSMQSVSPSDETSGSAESGVRTELIAAIIIIILVVAVLVTMTSFVIIKKRKKRKSFDVSRNNNIELTFTNQIYDLITSDETDHVNDSRAIATSESALTHDKVSTSVLVNGGNIYAQYDTLGREDSHASDEKPHIYEEESFYHQPVPSQSESTVNGSSSVKITTTALPVNEDLSSSHLGDYDLVQQPLDVFDEAGVYVPTCDERTNWEDGDRQTKKVYDKLGFFEEEDIYWAPASTTSDLYSQLASKKYREIPRSQLTTLEEIGSGEFGQVCKALWSLSGATKELAVKTLREELPEEEKVRFLQEAAIMGQFSHPNVVKLYGVVTVGEPVMICIELLSKGDLRDYLCSLTPNAKNSNELQIQFLKFMKEIATGMNYLSQKSFIHRDLATRNVLLDGDFTCKIGDFGMARDLMDDTYYTSSSKGKKIPVKWTAPEALLFKKYSTDSDVWSYGMVLFEIWSVGKRPFSQLSNNDVIRKLNSGYNQPPPPGCTRAIYQLMINCWNPDHSSRPSFSDILRYLNNSHNLLQSSEDTTPSSRSRELGAPLFEGESLYTDLQTIYLNN